MKTKKLVSILLAVLTVLSTFGALSAFAAPTAPTAIALNEGESSAWDSKTVVATFTEEFYKTYLSGKSGNYSWKVTYTDADGKTTDVSIAATGSGVTKLENSSKYQLSLNVTAGSKGRYGKHTVTLTVLALNIDILETNVVSNAVDVQINDKKAFEDKLAEAKKLQGLKKYFNDSEELDGAISDATNLLKLDGATSESISEKAKALDEAIAAYYIKGNLKWVGAIPGINTVVFFYIDNQEKINSGIEWIQKIIPWDSVFSMFIKGIIALIGLA
ncbi:MAG: hypothetical protein LBJ11_07475 [Oscillospiraceae bacterium]|nr:hypothetical protein [Oscillospiraceae bacterium]